MTDTRPTANSRSYACTYEHHPGVLGCQSLAAKLPEPWERFGLTRRERDVAGLLTRGVSNKGIALALCVQVQTVKEHVSHILEKTRADNRTMAALRLSSAT